MKRIRIRTVAAGLALTLSLAATGCSPDSGDTPSTAPEQEQPAGEELATEATAESRAASAATTVTLDGDAIAVDGPGAQADGTTLSITSGGSYHITGTLDGGQIYVETDKSEAVELILDGVTITAAQNAAIYCAKGDALTITLADGSVNTLTDAADYTYADADAEEPDAALFSKTDLTIGGSGTLNINGNFHNGIGTKDDLVITGGTLNITAANHGIRGRDSITIQDGTFTINSGNDGINSNNDGENKGWITISGGTFQITSDHDGIQAESGLTISGGTYTILAGNGADSTSASADESYKGLKAGGDLTVTGGTFAIDAADDGVHSNNNIVIDNGTFTIATGDDGIHADEDLTINGGKIDITQSYEGIEGNNITITGGEVSLVAQDDGLNVAGGSESGGGGRFGPDSFGSGGSSRMLTITGGVIYIDAEGDGIDINGSGEISGGEIYVAGPVRGGNGALDFDGTLNITGGTVIALGGGSMDESPSASSTQPSLMIYFSDNKEAGSVVAISDADGNQLASYTSVKSFRTAVFTAPGMEQGGAYTVTLDGAEVLTTTLSEAVTTLSDTGEAVSGFGFGMGGGGGRGGMGQQGGMDRPTGERGGDFPGGERGAPPGDRQ